MRPRVASSSERRPSVPGSESAGLSSMADRIRRRDRSGGSKRLASERNARRPRNMLVSPLGSILSSAPRANRLLGPRPTIRRHCDARPHDPGTTAPGVPARRRRDGGPIPALCPLPPHEGGPIPARSLHPPHATAVTHADAETAHADAETAADADATTPPLMTGSESAGPGPPGRRRPRGLARRIGRPPPAPRPERSRGLDARRGCRGRPSSSRDRPGWRGCGGATGRDHPAAPRPGRTLPPCPTAGQWPVYRPSRTRASSRRWCRGRPVIIDRPG
jgi:hypothetical protein